MDVILLEKVENLGNIGDQVKVRSGYGRNYLLPKGKATLATPENIAVVEARRSEFEQKQAAELVDAEARKSRLAALRVTIPAKAGEEGKLFGSVGNIDIADACTAAGVDVQRSEVRMPDGPIRILGEHEIEIHLHSDVNVMINVSVVGDAVSAEEIAVMSQVSDAAGVSDADAAAGEPADDEAGQS